jgi:hypothetical protein
MNISFSFWLNELQTIADECKTKSLAAGATHFCNRIRFFVW